MARASSRKRGNPKDKGRRKKVSILATEKIDYVDYKDVDLLKRFMSDRAKIRGRRVNGNDVQQQRVIAKAIKNSREMGLLPYTSRVTTQRRGRTDRPDGPRRPRDEELPDDAEATDDQYSDEVQAAAVETGAVETDAVETDAVESASVDSASDEASEETEGSEA